MRLRHRAFTLVELLIVLGIVALLVALIVAASGAARESARQRTCVSNLHQIGLAFAMYSNDYDGSEPVQGQPIQYWQLGLPNPTAVPEFIRTYVKDKQVMLCPDYHGITPIAQRNTTYLWSSAEDMPEHAYYSFSAMVARRGELTPLLSCDSHNGPINFAKAPRWAQMRVIVLRLNQQVQSELVPVRSVTDSW